MIFSVSADAQIFLKKIDLANMEVEYPSEILIERGWTKYVSFAIKNIGETDLYNVNVLIEGTNSNWFEFQNNKTDIITSNEKVEFISKISIPYEMAVGSYKFSFSVNSNEISYKTDFNIRVFDTRDDLLLYQVQNLRNDLKELEDKTDEIERGGINMTSARELFSQIRSELNLAEEQIQSKMYAQLTESIREIEKLFIKANYEVSNPIKKIEFEKNEELLTKDTLLLFSGVGIALLSISLIYLIRKIRVENKVRLPNLRIKELIVENKKLKELENELEKIRESEEIIEQEYREDVITKESYEELKMKYQERLLDLESERKKLRGY